MLAPGRLFGCLICIRCDEIIQVRVSALLQLHAVSARMFLHHKSTWVHSGWGSFMRVDDWFQCLRNLLHLLVATHWWCSPLHERFAPLYVIQGVRGTVNAELRLESIAADPGCICIISIFLHSDIPGGHLRFNFLQNAVCWLVWRWAWPHRILRVNIRIKPGWLATYDDPRSINVLRVFLCMKGCSILSSLLSPFMVFPVVGIWRWN